MYVDGQGRGNDPRRLGDEYRRSTRRYCSTSRLFFRSLLGWLNVLSDYSAALVAVTDATDRAALVDAQGKLAASVKALAQQHDDAVIARASAGDAEAASKPLIAETAAASAGLIAAITNAILDQQRLAVLKAAVQDADELVGTLAHYIGEEQVAIQASRSSNLANYASRLTVELGPASERAEYDSAIDKALAATSEVDAIIGANPRRAAEKMANAHKALANAVASGKGQSLIAIESITDFVAAATAVRDSLGRTVAEPT